MKRAIIRLVLLTAAFALATRALGWWAVPATAAAWCWLDGGSLRAPWDAALAAMLGWAAILLWTAATGPLGELTRRTAEIFNAPPLILVGATLLYGGLLAWSAGTLAATIRSAVKGNR